MKAIFVLLYLCFLVALFFFYVYGLVAAFSASIILGIIALLLPPTPTVLGLVAFFGDPNICEIIVQWLGLP